MTKENLLQHLQECCDRLFGCSLEMATEKQVYRAVCVAVRELLEDDRRAFVEQTRAEQRKQVYYMSMEFLVGTSLRNNLYNMGLLEPAGEILHDLGFSLESLCALEPDAGLGNGGLGRLAACFLDSLATLGYPAYGCGIRYRYGMFKQKIENGYQVEVPDNWLKDGNPFELRRPEYAKEVKFGGYVHVEYDEATGQSKFIQKDYQSVRAVPFDIPVVGYGNGIVNTLRVWDAEAINDFHLDSFNKGEYMKAVEQENLAKNIVEVLYPADEHYAGKELRLKQQYFFVSASVQAAIAKYKKNHSDIRKFYEKATFQLNDTHPTVAVAELMRILMDEE